jgi:hypothetical protein
MLRRRLALNELSVSQVFADLVACALAGLSTFLAAAHLSFALKPFNSAQAGSSSWRKISTKPTT